MKFLRTSSTHRLLAAIAGLVVAIAAGTAIAVAATSSGPVPQPKPLATAMHDALGAPAVKGISARISFTNNLISSADFTGGPSDPILQGASGRLWLSNDHQLRLELQTTNGDTEVVVDHNSFWISDPTQNTLYEGTLPADTTSSSSTGDATGAGVPTIAAIQSELTKLAGHANVDGSQTSNPTDVAGRPAYSVTVSPKHDGGLLGQAQLAWDAATGVPLDIAVYARNNPTPVLELKATDISYGAVGSSVFSIKPQPGEKVVKVSTAQAGNAAAKHTAKAKHAHVSGVAAVAQHLSFPLAAPGSVAGLPRKDVTLLDWGGKPAALVSYGQGLGGVAVIEQQSDSPAKSTAPPARGGLSLPTVSINGSTAQELPTALGTMLRFTRSGVSYTVVGSVLPYAAEQAARELTATP